MTILQFPSRLFTSGRDCSGPVAIVLHEWSGGLDMLDLAMDRCPRPRPAQSPGCHTSFHYGVAGSFVHQYVADADTAWGFGVTAPTCPEPSCPPDPCESCTGETDDQYLPDSETGLAPTLPSWSLGADGTVNCAVLHVAINNSGISTSNQPGCCGFIQQDPDLDKAYAALVHSLAVIFIEAGLDPIFSTDGDTESTLLVHCDELVCLDLAQLAEDIAAEIIVINTPPVLPPCNCDLGVDITAVDSDSVDLTIVETPTNSFTVQADVIISADSDNLLSIADDGLLVEDPWADAPACGSLPVNFVVLGGDGTGGPAQWGTPARPQLVHSDLVTASNVDPSLADVFTYSDEGDGAFTLLSPAAGECPVRDIWIKNLSEDDLTVASASLIDGQPLITLDGVIVAGYPFGNNGGESVHLFWTGSTWLVL